MRRALDWYQYLGPVILGPIGYGLWWRHYDGDHRMAALAFTIPVVFAYVVPALGTNVFKVWEFDVRVRLGRFRPHHGFVFGSATAVLALPAFADPNPAAGVGDAVLTGFLVASVLGFWNWIYDIVAIRSGVLRVYNQPYADGAGAAAVATDYAPVFFGGFGLAFGAGLTLAEGVLLPASNWSTWAMAFLAVTGVCLATPVAVYVVWSQVRHGHSGCRPIGERPQ